MLRTLGPLLLLLLHPSRWPAGPLQDAGLNTAEIVSRLIAQNQAMARTLVGYTSTRHYHLEFHGVDSLSADLRVRATYRAPDRKMFRVESQSGSGFLIRRVLLPLLKAETEAARLENREQTELTGRNYTFRAIGSEQVSGRTAYVLEVIPKRASKFLFKGTIDVDDQVFALIHIRAEPAKNPSWWTAHNQIEETYSPIGEFWLPSRNTTSTSVRFLGHAFLTIEYGDYHLTTAKAVTRGR